MKIARKVSHLMEMKDKKCFELGINIDEAKKDLVAALLHELEIDNFVYGSIECDIEAEYDSKSVNYDHYSNLVKETPLIIYSEDMEYLNRVQQALSHLFPSMGIELTKNTFFIRPISDQNWRESWKHSFKPINIDDVIIILPPWEKKEQFQQKFKIVINPGMAFGTGQHETTQLCLKAMLQKGVPQKVLDVGTGSGILAIAAKMLGAKYVYAIDIDPESIHVALDNAKINNVPDIHFKYDQIENIKEENFDLVIANIQCKPLKQIIGEMKKRVSKNGILILSGILVSEKIEFSQFLSENQIIVEDIYSLNDWCSLICILKK